MNNSDPPRIGARVLRIEDARLLSGGGRYVDDFHPADVAYAYFLRSPHAHARLGAVDIEAARAAPGVLAVLTGEDVAGEGLGDIPCLAAPPPPTGATLFRPPFPLLARGTVRFVGDRVAMVIAETRDQAKDAAELIAVEYEPLSAVVSLEAAIAPEGHRVWPQAEGNLCFRIERGERGAVDRVLAGARHRVMLVSRYPRIAGNALEPRAAIGSYDAIMRRYTLYACTQAAHRVKELIAGHILHIPVTDLRVVAFDVGGGFGTKGGPFPEEVLVLWAARKIGRPVKWTAERGEAMVSDNHGRDRIDFGEAAFDDDGRILALKLDIAVNAGAYLSLPAGVPSINAERMSAVYHLPHYHVVVRTVFTNTNPLGPYRGTGRPEANLFLERLLDKAAPQLGLDREALRRRNLIAATSMPYKAPGGHTIDSGEFERILDRGLELADWNGFAARRESSRQRERLRGIGLGMYVILSSSTMQPERMEIRVEPDATFSVLAGTHASGQGHETMYGQMVAGWLGVPLALIRVCQGDTDRIPFGRGTSANRSAMMGGSALYLAKEDLIRNAKRFAAWILETSEADIKFEDGRFVVSGTDRAVTFKEIAHRCYNSAAMPPDLPVGLTGVGGYSGPPSFPNGCIICEVEIDAETGVVTLDRCASVSDSGTVINPLMLEGQMHGSIAHAAGEMLIEEVRYDAKTGQILSGSFMDYGLPRADVFPSLSCDFIAVPAKTNPLGVKGGSESGSAGTPAALCNAILDALAPLGVTDIALPATPERVWTAIRNAQTGRPTKARRSAAE